MIREYLNKDETCNACGYETIRTNCVVEDATIASLI